MSLSLAFGRWKAFIAGKNDRQCRGKKNGVPNNCVLCKQNKWQEHHFWCKHNAMHERFNLRLQITIVISCVRCYLALSARQNDFGLFIFFVCFVRCCPMIAVRKHRKCKIMCHNGRRWWHGCLTHSLWHFRIVFLFFLSLLFHWLDYYCSAAAHNCGVVIVTQKHFVIEITCQSACECTTKKTKNRREAEGRFICKCARCCIPWPHSRFFNSFATSLWQRTDLSVVLHYILRSANGRKYSVVFELLASQQTPSYPFTHVNASMTLQSTSVIVNITQLFITHADLYQNGMWIKECFIIKLLSCCRASPLTASTAIVAGNFLPKNRSADHENFWKIYTHLSRKRSFVSCQWCWAKECVCVALLHMLLLRLLLLLLLHNTKFPYGDAKACFWITKKLCLVHMAVFGRMSKSQRTLNFSGRQKCSYIRKDCAMCEPRVCVYRRVPLLLVVFLLVQSKCENSRSIHRTQRPTIYSMKRPTWSNIRNRAMLEEHAIQSREPHTKIIIIIWSPKIITTKNWNVLFDVSKCIPFDRPRTTQNHKRQTHNNTASYINFVKWKFSEK